MTKKGPCKTIFLYRYDVKTRQILMFEAEILGTRKDNMSLARYQKEDGSERRCLIAADEGVPFRDAVWFRERVSFADAGAAFIESLEKDIAEHSAKIERKREKIHDVALCCIEAEKGISLHV